MNQNTEKETAPKKTGQVFDLIRELGIAHDLMIQASWPLTIASDADRTVRVFEGIMESLKRAASAASAQKAPEAPTQGFEHEIA